MAILSGRTIPTTVLSGRPSIQVSNTMPVLITGLWDDTLLWDDALYWNDNGNSIGTILYGRTIPA